MHYHMHIDVKGVLKNWTKKELRGMFLIDGKPSTASQTQDILLDELAQGHTKIPFGKCDNFDYNNGCLGHPESGKD